MSSSVTIKLDDREEGEIVDDENVFEDISDNSISDIEEPFCSGKSVLHKENLRTISLSSVSDGDNLNLNAVRLQHHGRKTRRRRRSRSEKRNGYLKRRMSAGHSSDSDNSSRLKKRLKKQLKEAVRIDTASNPHNSLRDRLQGMVKLSDDCQNKESEQQHMIGSTKSKFGDDVKVDSEKVVEYDRELQELRLEALKTAILNKHRHRKKRIPLGQTDEIVMSDSSQKSDVLETNKENSATINNLEVTNQGGLDCTLPVDLSCDNVTNSAKLDLPSPSEEDADALRALLLASISNKATAMKVDETFDSIKNKVIEIKTVNSSTSLQVNKKDPDVDQTAHRKELNSSMKNKAQSNVKKITSSKIQRFPVTNQLNLASSSKKLAVNNFSVASSSKIPPINHLNVTSIIKNQVVNAKNRYPPTTLITDVSLLPPVKPLIIKVDSDSDSDSEEDLMFHEESVGEKDISVNRKENLERQEITDVTVPIEIQNSLEHLLKEERAKVEAESVNKTPQKINLETDILEKSAVKLLPRDKQIEYRRLISKIRNRTNKNLLPVTVKSLTSIRQLGGHTKGETATKSYGVNLSGPIATGGLSKKACSEQGTAQTEKNHGFVGQKGNNVLPVTSIKPSCTVLINPAKKSTKLVNSINREVRLNGTTGQVVSNTKVVSHKSVTHAGLPPKSVLHTTNGTLQGKNLKQGSDDAKKLEVTRFRMARKDIYLQNNGRLQIKAQYQSLNDLMKKINKADAEKKKHELHMKKLLEELCQVQKQVSQCNASYSCLVKEFVNKKYFIDKSTKQVVQQKLTTNKEHRIKDISKLNRGNATVSVDVKEAKVGTTANDGGTPTKLLIFDPSKVVALEIAKQGGEISIKEQEKNSNVPQTVLTSTTTSEIDKIVEFQLDNIDVGKLVPDAKGKVLGSYVSPLGNSSRWYDSSGKCSICFICSFCFFVEGAKRSTLWAYSVPTK